MEPLNAIAKATGRGAALGSDGIGGEVMGRARWERPCVISRVSWRVGRAIPGANKGTDSEAKGDVRCARAGGGEDSEAGGDGSGKVGGAKGARRANREGGEGGRGGDKGGGSERSPFLLPLAEVAMFC